jgi:hypothetical protein
VPFAETKRKIDAGEEPFVTLGIEDETELPFVKSGLTPTSSSMCSDSRASA